MSSILISIVLLAQLMSTLGQTIKPTLKPTTFRPSNPSFKPTIKPTMKPSITMYPTKAPTFAPSGLITSYQIDSVVDLGAAKREIFDAHTFYPTGDTYFTDVRRNQVLKMSTSTPSGILFAGLSDGSAGFSGDGGPATSAQLNGPHYLASKIDLGNNMPYFLVVADSDNHCVRRINFDTNHIETMMGVCGVGTTTPVPGGAATSTLLNRPMGVSYNQNSQIAGYIGMFVTDYNANMIYLWEYSTRKSKRASPVGFYNKPMGLVTEISGWWHYVANSGDHTVVRQLSEENWTVTTMAGSSGVSGSSGDGALAVNALLNTPKDVWRDQFNNIFVCDAGNSVIRRIQSGTGIITVVSGTYGVVGTAGDGGPALSAEHNMMTSVDGNLIDTLFVGENSTVRAVYSATIAPTFVPTWYPSSQPSSQPTLTCIANHSTTIVTTTVTHDWQTWLL